MTTTVDEVKQAVLDAGFEVYRTDQDRITLAERVRLHLMDSGVMVTVEASPRVSFTVRSQRSNSPNASAEDLFARVRGAMAILTSERSFDEVGENTREVVDPVDETNVLDVWYELTYEKSVDTLELLIDDLRWALSLPKCVDSN